MNKVETFSLCVKITLFIDKNIKLKKDELLYLISLSDFYKNEAMLSKNIKNINSLNYYTSKINESIAYLLATNMLTFYGKFFILTAKGKIFINKIYQNPINEELIKKVEFVSKTYNCKDSLDKIYDELVKKFILSNLGGNNEN